MLRKGTSNPLIIVAALLLASWILPGLAHAQKLEATEDTITVNGVDLYFRSIGSGPPLLLVHGMTTTGRLWDPFVDDLSAEYRVIIPDMRGHGRSTNPSGQFRHQDVAQDLIELIRHLNYSEVHAIGWSSGAIAILDLAILNPGLLKAAVLVDGAHRFPDQTREVLSSLYADDFIEMEPWYWNRVISWHPGGRNQLDELFRQLRTFGANPAEGQHTQAQLATISAPTLIVHGDRDGLYPVRLALEMHDALPSSELWVMPGVSHAAIFAYHYEPSESRCIPCEAAGHQFTKMVSDFFHRAESQQ